MEGLRTLRSTDRAGARSVAAFLALLVVSGCCLASGIPELPERDGVVQVPAQSHAQNGPGRTIDVHICYPGGTLSAVKPTTGLLLSLHNWGGSRFAGAPNPDGLTGALDCIVIGVDYFQSGSENSDLPYDFGWLQALDVLRALKFVISSLERLKIPFSEDRIFVAGGSGGGNVSLMANKLAPRTFAVVVDISGMKRLSDDIAFNEQGGSNLDARYSTDPQSAFFLSADAREIRELGHPEHLSVMKTLGNNAKVISIHGESDASCPFSDAQSFADAMRESGLDFEFHPVGRDDVDGVLFRDSGHSLGDRTEILLHFAGRYLKTAGNDGRRLAGPTDFDRKEPVSYETASGRWIVDYSGEFPAGRFESSNAAP
jgi:hypothetical protein